MNGINATLLTLMNRVLSVISQFGRVAAQQINHESVPLSAKLAPEGRIMADLRITGVSNNQLELQAPDGGRHYLEISDDLLKAMKSRPTSLPKNLSVREIQTEIRLGTSIEELVARTGADEDHISKYAAPIITELNHIVTLARNVRLSLTSDRFTDPNQIEFGTVMDERLQVNKATNATWSSRKSVEGEWLVCVKFSLQGTSGTATWSFEPKNFILVPENQSALQLSNATPLTIGESARLPKQEQQYHPTNSIVPVETQDEPTIQTSGLTIVPELVEIETIESEDSAEVISIVESETRATFHVVDNQFQEFQVEEIEQTQEPVIFEEVIEGVVEVLEPEPVQEPQNEEPYTPAKNQSTSRWAEVLFGAKEEDED